MSFKDRLKQARTAAKPKITQGMIAESLGVTLQAVSAWERGKNMPEPHHISALSGILGVTTDWLLGNNLHHPVTQETHQLRKIVDTRESLIAAHPQNGVTMSSAGHNNIKEMPAYGERDLPLYGTTPKGRGIVALTEDVDYDQRPSYLLNVKKAYAVIVPDDAMSDRFEADFIAYVDPTKTPKPGKYCVFRSKTLIEGQTLIYIRRLKSQTDDTWVVEQNHPRKTYSLKKADWPECHVIVGSHFRD